MRKSLLGSLLSSLLPPNVQDKGPWQERESLHTHLGKIWLPNISSALNFAVVTLNHVNFCQKPFHFSWGPEAVANVLSGRSLKFSFILEQDFLTLCATSPAHTALWEDKLHHLSHVLASLFLISSGQFVLLSLQMGREWIRKDRTVWTKCPH